jgi:hypothetical protein
MSETCCDTDESYAETATVNVFELYSSSVKEMINGDVHKDRKEEDQEMGEVEYRRFKSQGEEIGDVVEHLIELEAQQKTPLPGRKSDLGPTALINSLSPLLRPLKFDHKVDFYRQQE